MANKLQTTVLSAFLQEDSQELNILLSEVGGEKTGILEFKTKSWDDDKKELVDDPLVKEETDKELEEIFGLTFDDIAANPLAITGQEVEAFYDEAYEKFRLNEPANFIRYQQITEDDVDAINDFADTINKNNPVQSLPIEDHYGVRIKVGIEVPELGNYRISSFNDGKSKAKLNYANKKINTMKEAIENTDDADEKKALEMVYDATVKSARASRLNGLQSETGLDFEHLAKINGVVNFKKIIVQNFTTGKDTIYFLEAALADDQEDIEYNEKAEEEYKEKLEEEDE